MPSKSTRNNMTLLRQICELILTHMVPKLAAACVYVERLGYRHCKRSRISLFTIPVVCSKWGSRQAGLAVKIATPYFRVLCKAVADLCSSSNKLHIRCMNTLDHSANDLLLSLSI